MKDLTAGAGFVAALLLANLVAAGVMQILGPLAASAQDERVQIAGIAAAGVLAVGCSLLFLKGCLRALIEATTMPGRPARGKGSAHGPER